MGSTNKTANYDLSQYIGTDVPSWLQDYNGDMAKIDAQMKKNEDAIGTGDTGLEAVKSRVTAQEQLTANMQTEITSQTDTITSIKADYDTVHHEVVTNTSNIDSLTTRVTNNTSNIDSLTTRVTNNTSNIDSLTTRVTNNEGNISSLGTSVGTLDDVVEPNTVLTTGSKSVTGAINELADDVSELVKKTNKMGFYHNSTGNVFYVSNSGSDSNDGSKAHPFATIFKAFDSAPIGRLAIYLNGGDTFNIESEVRSNYNILIASYGTGKATVNLTSVWQQYPYATLSLDNVIFNIEAKGSLNLHRGYLDLTDNTELKVDGSCGQINNIFIRGTVSGSGKMELMNCMCTIYNNSVVTCNLRATCSFITTHGTVTVSNPNFTNCMVNGTWNGTIS